MDHPHDPVSDVLVGSISTFLLSFIVILAVMALLSGAYVLALNLYVWGPLVRWYNRLLRSLGLVAKGAVSVSVIGGLVWLGYRLVMVDPGTLLTIGMYVLVGVVVFLILAVIGLFTEAVVLRWGSSRKGVGRRKVECDDDCGAFYNPKTLEEYRAALHHWKYHSCLDGCSHGC